MLCGCRLSRLLLCVRVCSVRCGGMEVDIVIVL